MKKITSLVFSGLFAVIRETANRRYKNCKNIDFIELNLVFPHE